MKKLMMGLHHFSANTFERHKELFRKLAREGQEPETLFITCSDSRIVPFLLTGAGPGDLFVLRNAGNLVPSYGSGEPGCDATIEYAVRVLCVKEIVVCGHTGCGAIHALLDDGVTRELPALKRWLEFARRTRVILDDHYKELDEQERLDVAIQENVLSQIENLHTHPAVATRMVKGDLRIHGWVYDLARGEVFAYDEQGGQFRELTLDGPEDQEDALAPLVERPRGEPH